MPVRLDSISFFSELQGVSDEPVDWLLANVGDKIRIETELTVLTTAAASTDSPMLLNAKDGGYIGDSWVVDPNSGFTDFRVGDTVLWGNYVTGAFFQTLTIAEKKDDGAIRFVETLGAPATGADDEETIQSIFSVATPITAIRYKYNFIENDEDVNFFSKVSGTEQVLAGKDLDADDPTPVNMFFIGELSYQIGSATIEGLGIEDGTTDGIYSSAFKIIHEAVITPFMLASQRTDLIDGTAPDYFFNTKCLKGVFDFEAMYNYTDPNRIQTLDITEVIGNTGWFDENFNTGITNYSIDAVVFKENTSAGDAVDSVILDATTNTYFTFDVENATDTPFVDTETKLIINFIKLPEDEDEYKLNGATIDDNFIFDRVVLTLGDPAANGENYGFDGQIFEQVTSAYNSAGSVTIEGTINMASAGVTLCSESTTPMYAIWISVQEEGIAMASADKVSLMVSKGEFTIQTDDPNLIQITNKFIPHPEEEDCVDFPELAIPAELSYDASAWLGGSATFNMTLTFNILIGGSNIVTVVGQSSIDGAWAAMVIALNTADADCEAAYDSGTNVLTMKNPTDIGSAGNGKILSSITFTGGGQPTNITPSGATFSGGVDAVITDQISVFPEDEVVAYSRFYIDKTGVTDDVVLKNITCRIKARSDAADEEFTIEEYTTDVTNALVISDNQYFDIQQDRVFHLPADEIRKTIRIYRRADLDTGNLVYYDVIYPFMVRWEYWKALALANDVFWDVNDPNNGWNQFWNNYAVIGDWRPYYELEINATKGSDPQQYIYEHEMSSNDYDIGAEWDPKTIKTYDPDTLTELYDSISGRRYILGYKNTLVEARFEQITGTPDLDNITVVFGLEVYEEGGIDGRRRYSSRNPADADTWFQSLNGDDLVELTLVGDVVVAKVLIDFSLIPSTYRFSISARIYDTVGSCT